MGHTPIPLLAHQPYRQTDRGYNYILLQASLARSMHQQQWWGQQLSRSTELSEKQWHYTYNMTRVRGVNQQNDGGELVVKAKRKKHLYLTVFQMLIEHLITLKKESLSAHLWPAALHLTAPSCPLLSQMVYSETYVNLIQCQQMLKKWPDYWWWHKLICRPEKFATVAHLDIEMKCWGDVLWIIKSAF